MPEAEVLAQYRNWFTNFAEQGGNFARIWLGVPFFDVMPDAIGQFDERATEHIRFVVDLAEKLGIKLKFTLEHFRRTVPNVQDAESFPGVVSFVKPLYAPYAQNMQEYLASPVCQQAYLAKAKYLSSQGFGDSPAVACWELWNEINSIGNVYGPVGEWSRTMIPELQKLFPKQLILQNLGSFASDTSFRDYDYLAGVEGNAFLQIHCYLDPGAALDFCRGPMDVLAAQAIRELKHRGPSRPAILAECGAVEANHARYSDLYEDDTQGVLLHDILFAPFFSGSAGCGQPWHWDHIYLSKHNLWHHFGRFARAIQGIDPAEETFQVFYTETKRLRVYGLTGKHHTLVWCRDKASTWEAELKKRIPAAVISGETLRLPASAPVTCDLVWEDRQITVIPANGNIPLPDFTRSLVLRFLSP
ncbi:MAG: hypothetical protein IJJ26_04380 [Victivallales bacterium]|nr:hypothetical protein [Victivallales bacterium]